MTPEGWIEAATDLLVDGGVDLLRVDVLAKRIGVTRGSFYWHFRDRDDLLSQVLRTWREKTTDEVTCHFADTTADPAALVHELVNLPFRGRSAIRAARVELAIRDWARRDPMARQAVDEADATRLSYIAQCFTALGVGIPEARARAGILYAYELGESLLAHQGTDTQKAARSALLERLLLAEPASPKARRQHTAE